MILFDLLAVLVVGISSFLISRIIDFFRPKRKQKIRKKYHAKPRRPSRNQIERDLDKLLLLHKQGILTEGEYHYQANELIDQLADVIHADASLTHS